MPVSSRRRWFQLTLGAALLSTALINMATGEAPPAKNARSTASEAPLPIPKEFLPVFEASFERHQQVIEDINRLLAIRLKEHRARGAETKDTRKLVGMAEVALEGEKRHRRLRPPLLVDLSKPGAAGGLAKGFSITRIVGEKQLEVVDGANEHFFIEGFPTEGLKEGAEIAVGHLVQVLPSQQHGDQMMICLKVVDWATANRLYEQWLNERDSASK